MAIRPIDMQQLIVNNNENSKAQQNSNTHAENMQTAIAQNNKKNDEIKQNRVNDAKKAEAKKIKDDKDKEKNNKKYNKYTKYKKLDKQEYIEEKDKDDDTHGHIDIKI